MKIFIELTQDELCEAVRLLLVHQGFTNPEVLTFENYITEISEFGLADDGYCRACATIGSQE